MVAVPLMWLSIMTVVQLGLFGYAHNLANVAARQAAQVSALDGASGGDGVAVGKEFGADSFVWQGDPTVSVVRGDDVTEVTVVGTVVAIFPTPWETVTGSASTPTEQFVPAR